jgi:hypothetical protein
LRSLVFRRDGALVTSLRHRVEVETNTRQTMEL